MKNKLFLTLALFGVLAGGFSSCQDPEKADNSNVAAVEVTLDCKAATLTTGDEQTLAVTFLPGDADKTVTWESSNQAVATVDETGKVTALAPGKTTVTVTTADKARAATCIVTVYEQEKWGRSNVVWIPDARLESGGILTFAVTPEDHFDNGRTFPAGDVDVALPAIPAGVQGVFFKWGSLVAVSPVGASPALFAPSGNISFDEYARIPSMAGVNTAPFGDAIIGDADDFASFNGTGFDADTDLGDICRYISAQGWVRGSWRLPTAQEIEDIAATGQAVWSGSTWTNIDVAGEEGNNANGFYEPLSGYFVGEGVTAEDDRSNPAHGISLSASGYHGTSGVTNTGYRGFVWTAASAGFPEGPEGSAHCLGGSVTAGRMYHPREAGFSVRCVRN